MGTNQLILDKITKLLDIRPLTLEEHLLSTKRGMPEPYLKTNDLQINPANGLPMIGSVDVMGNAFGSNTLFDHYHRNQNNYLQQESMS